MVVLDASALVEAVSFVDQTTGIDRLIGDPSARMAVPHLCDLEVVSAVRRLTAAGVMSPSNAQEALISYEMLPLLRFSHTAHLRRIFSLRHNFSPYDAVYVALAESLAARFLTADSKLAQAVRDHTDVEVVEA